MPVDVAPQMAALSGDEIDADAAVDTLVAIGPAVIPAVTAGLAREPLDVRTRLVDVLARLETPDATAALIAVAGDAATPAVRAAAIRALGTRREEGTCAPVEAALESRDTEVRLAAIGAAGTACRKTTMIPELTALALRDPDEVAALVARGSLARLRADEDGQPTAALRSGLEAVVRPILDDGHAPPALRVRAALIAADAELPGAGPALAASIGDVSPRLQRHAAWTLGIVGDATSVDALAAVLGAGDPMVQLYAVDALRKLGARGVEQAAAALALHPGPAPRSPLTPPDV